MLRFLFSKLILLPVVLGIVAINAIHADIDLAIKSLGILLIIALLSIVLEMWQSIGE
jgi:MFS-type transporter involved in bile tolerance (Atg22 family)